MGEDWQKIPLTYCREEALWEWGKRGRRGGKKEGRKIEESREGIYVRLVLKLW